MQGSDQVITTANDVVDLTITQDYDLFYDIDQNLSFGTVALTTGW